MKKENESIFMIQYKDYNGKKPFISYGSLPTLDANDAMLFETRTKAYKYMLEHDLDKKCIAVEYFIY